MKEVAFTIKPAVSTISINKTDTSELVTIHTHNASSVNTNYVDTSGNNINKTITMNILPSDVEREIERSSNIPDSFYILNNQYELIRDFVYKCNCPERKIVEGTIKGKLSSYKTQDKKNGFYNPNKFISVSNTIDLLNSCKMRCNYCSKQLYLIYKKYREKLQWTLDRIDNNAGHNTGNVVIACLKCNLNRRRTNYDDFLFTKKLTIHKN
jgi:hypothetical protein